MRMICRKRSIFKQLLVCSIFFTIYAVCAYLNNAQYHTNSATFITNQTTEAGVPMLLHFVFKDSRMLESYRAGIESCIKLNANWTVILWTDESVKIFIRREFPQYEALFYRFHHKIQRSDIVRYLILYVFGGVYLDLDMHCCQPILTSLSHIPCFLDKEREHQTQVIHGRRFSAMNSAMGCRSNHPFFKNLVDSIFKFAIEGNNEPFRFPNTILQTTGPGALTRAYEDWVRMNREPNVTLLSESYFSPRINPRSGVYSWCRNNIKRIQARSTSELTLADGACLSVHNLGFEQSDVLFITNVTVAIHQFTHLGYNDQSSQAFNVYDAFPGILTYPYIR